MSDDIKNVNDWAKGWNKADLVYPSPYTADNPTGAPTPLPARAGGLVVPIPTAESAQEAVNATLDSADERDMNEILNTQGDLHSVGSNEANAESIRSAAKTADEVAVEEETKKLEEALDKVIDDISEAAFATPEIAEMIEAALADEDPAEDPKTPAPSQIQQFVVNRIIVLEQTVAAQQIILEQFRDRAMAAFKHAGFKF